jgi:hypothetical protein
MIFWDIVCVGAGLFSLGLLLVEEYHRETLSRELHHLRSELIKHQLGKWEEHPKSKQRTFVLTLDSPKSSKPPSN